MQYLAKNFKIDGSLIRNNQKELSKEKEKQGDNIHKKQSSKTVGQTDINTCTVSELNNQNIDE